MWRRGSGVDVCRRSSSSRHSWREGGGDDSSVDEDAVLGGTGGCRSNREDQRGAETPPLLGRGGEAATLRKSAKPPNSEQTGWLFKHLNSFLEQPPRLRQLRTLRDIA